MLTETLFDKPPMRHTDGTTLNFTNLKKLQEKETRLFLHAVTLSDYLRSKRIPRGLRMNKYPMLSKDNDRWCEILNKCSFDLMALTIQEVSARAKVREKIISQRHLQIPYNYLMIWKTIKKELAKEIMVFKKKKFERHLADYQRGTVYKWRKSLSDQPETMSEKTQTGKRG